MFLRYLCVFVLFSAAAAQAQTRYVDDELIITLRTGPSSQNEIIRTLSSGTRVEILEGSDEDEYSRVRVPAQGLEGWVLNQYLTEERIAADRLADAERELSVATERVAELEERVDELGTELESARSGLDAARADNSQLESELEDVRSASENAIATRDQNERLRRQVSELSQQLESARMVNAELQSRSRQNWFVVGAGVLLGGIVIGLVAPSLRRRRRTNW